jgi:hypothetical protein
MGGFIQTFIRLLPDDIRTKYKVPRGLPALSEQRPLLHVLFLLNGSASELSLTGADFYRLPAASISRDEVDPETGVVTYGEIGGPDADTGESDAANEDSSSIVENTNQDPSSAQTVKTSNTRRTKRSRRVKYESGSSWMRISFPSCKDPSFEERYGKLSICVVTIEADDDFVVSYDTKPKIYVIKKPTASTDGELGRLYERVKKDLLDYFPQLEGKIEHHEVRGPQYRGLSHTPERYAAKGVRADTPYPGLFVGGSDLTIGDSFSGATVGGWLVANAVVGYSALDHLFLQKNISSDLEQFLESPIVPDEEDVAVPFTHVSPSVEETVDDEDEKDQ